MQPEKYVYILWDSKAPLPNMVLYISKFVKMAQLMLRVLTSTKEKQH